MCPYVVKKKSIINKLEQLRMCAMLLGGFGSFKAPKSLKDPMNFSLSRGEGKLAVAGKLHTK